MARLARAEEATHQRTLEELAQRRGVLRWVCYAEDAEPDPARPGKWRSETYDLIFSLPDKLVSQGFQAVGLDSEELLPLPGHDEA